MQHNGDKIPVAALITIAQLPNGAIQCQAHCPGGRVQFNAMMQTAIQDTLGVMIEAEKKAGAGIVQAPPGTVIR